MKINLQIVKDSPINRIIRRISRILYQHVGEVVIYIASDRSFNKNYMVEISGTDQSLTQTVKMNFTCYLTVRYTFHIISLIYYCRPNTVWKHSSSATMLSFCLWFVSRLRHLELSTTNQINPAAITYRRFLLVSKFSYSSLRTNQYNDNKSKTDKNSIIEYLYIYFY